MPKFEVVSEYKPAGDQPEAIAALAEGATAAFWSSCENISIPPHDSGAVGFHIRRTYRIVYQDLRTSSIVDARRCTIGFQATRG